VKILIILAVISAAALMLICHEDAKSCGTDGACRVALEAPQ